MYKYFIGLNDKNTKKQKIKTKKALKIVENIALKYLEYGATIEQARGIYKHTTGERVQENTITLLCDKLSDKAINELKTLLNQESIAELKVNNMSFK